MKKFINLPQFDGFSAYDGAIRFFPNTHHHAVQNIGLPTVDEWNNLSGWRSLYPGMGKEVQVFAEDSFGNQFARNEKDVVFILWVDTGELQKVATSTDHFIKAIMKDPSATLLLDEYLQCCEWLGKPGIDTHFVWKTALDDGGEIREDNLTLLPAAQHMTECGKSLASSPSP